MTDAGSLDDAEYLAAVARLRDQERAAPARHPALSRASWSEDCAISARSAHLDPNRNAPR
jgi:hypothetical protein